MNQSGIMKQVISMERIDKNDNIWNHIYYDGLRLMSPNELYIYKAKMKLIIVLISTDVEQQFITDRSSLPVLCILFLLISKKNKVVWKCGVFLLHQPNAILWLIYTRTLNLWTIDCLIGGVLTSWHLGSDWQHQYSHKTHFAKFLRAHNY